MHPAATDMSGGSRHQAAAEPPQMFLKYFSVFVLFM
jgi:hypothetical protein